MSNENVDLDKILCINSKKYGIEKILLKAIAVVESSLNPLAYRFEPDFFNNVLSKLPEWKDKDPKVVSASYGIMQVMFTTAWNLGFRGEAEDLYNPVYNIELAAKLIAQIRDQIIPFAHYKCWPMDIILARYNGGSRLNPGPDGRLRNWPYVVAVQREYWKLAMKEKNCD